MKLVSVASILAFSLATATAATMELASPLKNIQFVRAKALRPPTDPRSTGQYHKIKRLHGYPMGRSAVEALKKASANVPGNAYQNVTALTKSSTQYAIDVLWDDRPISLLFDTGSSDTWAVQTNFSCLSGLGLNASQSTCGWGPTTIDGFRYGETPDVHLAVQFGSGEQVVGPMGRSDITVSGMEVKQVQCGLANQTYWVGNNVTSGLLGLAYPSLTSSYMGAIGKETFSLQQSYEPFFSRMVSQGLVDPIFSVAIERYSDYGVIAWGGLPPSNMWTTSKTATSDIIVANLAGESKGAVTAYTHSFYTIVVDGISWGEGRDTTKHLYIVDTATSLIYLPPPVAESVANAFIPKGVFMYQYGMYFVDCDAIAPQLSVIIEGVKFEIVPDHLIMRETKDPISGLCLMGISTGGFGPYILGSVFLQNVVAVFDVGAAQMRFYARS